MKKKDGADESEDKTACVPVLRIKRRKPVWKQECFCPAWNIILPVEAGTAFRFQMKFPRHGQTMNSCGILTESSFLRIVHSGHPGK